MLEIESLRYHADLDHDLSQRVWENYLRERCKIKKWKIKHVSSSSFLASQDALEVMRVTYWVTYLLTESLSVSIDFTDVTLVSDDTYRRLYWCDPDDPNESYLVMKVI